MEEIKSSIFDRFPSRLRLGHCMESSKHPWMDYSYECSDCITYTHFMITKDEPEFQTSLINYYIIDHIFCGVRTPSIELVGIERGVKLPIESLPNIDQLEKKDDIAN